MSVRISPKCIWVPRILAGALIVLFLVLSLDAFGGTDSFPQQVFAFAMQSLPACAVTVLLVLSWKAPRLAGVLFVVLAVFFTVFFSTYRALVTFVAVSLVPIVIGACFLLAAGKHE